MRLASQVAILGDTALLHDEFCVSREERRQTEEREAQPECELELSGVAGPGAAGSKG